MSDFRPGKILVVLLIGLLAITGCRESGGEGEYFDVSGKLFEFNYRLGIATYVITLNPMRPVPDGLVAVVDFDNPAGGEPIEIQQKIWPKLPHQTLTSPPLACVAKDRPYAVSIRIEDQAGKLLQAFDITMTSTLDQSILPDRPLVIGPVYELNPDLVGHSDGKLPGGTGDHCPTS
jgi:hypothetical protein